jgi:glycosyltransferase involved in cell wall biosynthesis
MAAGVPIVATGSGAIPEVTAGHARLFSPGDWVGLAALLAEVLEGQDAPRERAETFSTATAAAGIAAAYEEMLELPPARARTAEPRI